MFKKNGFTMIELLVVIAIIGLLAVFLVPNLMGARDRAKEASVKSVLHSVQLAVEAYELENMTFPIAQNIAVASLCDNYLVKGSYIAETPKNPFTGKTYTDADTAGKIIYNYDASNDKYTLTGYNRTGSKKIQELSNM